MTEKYSDIINLPHPNHKLHIRMSISARAAQAENLCSPYLPFWCNYRNRFINRDKKLELDESIKEAINQKSMTPKPILKMSIVTITFFCPQRESRVEDIFLPIGYIKNSYFWTKKYLCQIDKIITNDIVKIQYEREK